MSDPLKVHVRWMIRRDMAEVLAIENACFEFPWNDDAFVRCLRQRNCIGMIAEIDTEVLRRTPSPAYGPAIGYMIYELHKARLHLLNIAVAPASQRRGVGKAMIEKLIGKLSQQRRSRIVLEVRESNLDCQLWLKTLGFNCVSTMRDFYFDTDEDAYVFSYRVRSEAEARRF